MSAPDPGWSRQRCARAGVELSLPPGVRAEEVEDQIRVALPSGFSYHLKAGDLPRMFAERKRWLETTPNRTNKKVLLDAPDAFVYSAAEGDLPDLSFTAGRAAGGVTWRAETHGAIVEHAGLEQQIASGLSPAEEARFAELQRLIGEAMMVRGQKSDHPELKKLMDELGALTRKAVPLEVRVVPDREVAPGSFTFSRRLKHCPGQRPGGLG